MPRVGNKRKKTRTHVRNEVPKGATSYSEEFQDKKAADNVPRSIVARAGKVGLKVSKLVEDVRKMMGPYTAANLKERATNRMKDYTTIAPHLGVSHLLMLSQTKKNVVLRIAKSETGPTMHFRVNEYSLMKEVRALQKRPMDSSTVYATPPLVVLNSFGAAEAAEGMQHVRLMRIMLQNMLPTIDVKTVQLSSCRRVILFNYLKEEGHVEVRHYAVKAQPVGISKSVKQVLRNKTPNLGKLQDISEFVEHGSGAGVASDSEAEDVGARVTLGERYRGRGNGATQQSAMKLTELGPRMKLELFKVERGVNEGDILYHRFNTKSAEAAAKTKNRIEAAKALKESRRKQQESNVARKAAEHAQKLAEKKAKREARLAEKEKAGRKRNRGDDSDDSDDEDDEEDALADDGGIDYSDVDDGESDDEADGNDDDEEEEEEEEEDEDE